MTGSGRAPPTWHPTTCQTPTTRSSCVPVLSSDADRAGPDRPVAAAVGGLTTAEIARAFLVPEATMAARISRAKQRIKSAAPFGRAARSSPTAARVLHVLYLIFNEGYTASRAGVERAISRTRRSA